MVAIVMEVGGAGRQEGPGFFPKEGGEAALILSAWCLPPLGQTPGNGGTFHVSVFPSVKRKT